MYVIFLYSNLKEYIQKNQHQLENKKVIKLHPAVLGDCFSQTFLIL